MLFLHLLKNTARFVCSVNYFSLSLVRECMEPWVHGTMGGIIRNWFFVAESLNISKETSLMKLFLNVSLPLSLKYVCVCVF